MTDLRITGIGTALPPHRLTQAEAVELHASFCGFDERKSRTLRALYRRSGVATRHSVLLEDSTGELPERQRFYPPSEHENDRGPTTVQRMTAYESHAPGLAVSAARRALDAGGIAGDQVTHLVTVSCTGFIAPGVDSTIVEALGLSRSVRRTHVGFMGCYGALAALRVVDSIVGADPTAVPLLCSVELCTLHFSYEWDPELLVANALFSDGSAAAVCREGGEGSWRVAATGTHLLAEAEDAMTWRIGDHGFRMTLSARIPDLIEADLKPWLEGWLGEHGLRLEDVVTWAIHPGGPRILSSCRRALALPRDATAVSEDVLAECGNMSSATVLFILERLASQGAEGPCVALAFGPGLAIEAALLV